MAYVKTQIYGGNFQDPLGVPLSGGWLKMRLSQDASVSLPYVQVFSGVSFKVPLDNNGSVSGKVYVWTDDVLNPIGTTYAVEAYNSRGLRVWSAPQRWNLVSGAPINIGAFVPTATS